MEAENKVEHDTCYILVSVSVVDGGKGNAADDNELTRKV